MRRRASLFAAFAGMFALLLGLDTAWGGELWGAIHRFAVAGKDSAGSMLARTAWDTLVHLIEIVSDAVGLATAAGAALAAAALVARMLAWRRLRDGRTDPLAWLRAHPQVARLVAWSPALLFLVVRWKHVYWFFQSINGPTGFEYVHMLLGYMLPPVLVAFGLGKLGQGTLREALAPLEDTAPAEPKSGADIVFCAVAVTPRTRAAVTGVAVASAAMALWVAAVPLATFQKSPAFFALVAAYVAAAAGAALAFRRASRIAVGIDGVYVGDTSRTRFLAYRELDEARASGADLELLRGGKVAMRIQMHGDDAGRRDEVLARVTEAVARAHQHATRGAELLVRAMPRRHVAAGAAGSTSYRDAAVSREQLWELVEGPTTDAATRTAAAEALAATLDGPGRARLRVAAQHCAEPNVRIAIGELAEIEDEEPTGREGAGA